MRKNITKLDALLHKRHLLLVLVALMIQTATGVKIVAMHQTMQTPHQTKHLKIGKDAKHIKQKYPKTYDALHEFALRSAPSSHNKQQVEFDRQSMAFCALEKAWSEATHDSDIRKAIKIGLLRWNWLPGDPILNNPRPVDWYMVYMECIHK